MSGARGWHEILAELAMEDSDEVGEQRSRAWSEAMAKIELYARGLLSGRRDLSAADIEDIAQDVVVKLRDAALLDRLRRLRSPEGYIVVSIRNAANDHARRARSERRSLERLASTTSGVVEPSSTPPGLGTDPRLERLQRALVKLTADELRLLRLRFWKNMTIGQIATRRRLRYSTVAVRLFRLLARLRAELDARP